MLELEWIRPSGTLIFTNDSAETKAMAKKAGWRRSKDGVAVTRTTKSKVAEDGDSSPSDQGLFATDIGTGFGGESRA